MDKIINTESQNEKVEQKIKKQNVRNSKDICNPN